MKCSPAPMWAELGDDEMGMKICPPVRLVDNQYLGSAQRDIFPSEKDIERMSTAFSNFSPKNWWPADWEGKYDRPVSAEAQPLWAQASWTSFLDEVRR